jgi:hypothetical protein
MHPLLLHQIADDHVIGRRRSDPRRHPHRRRPSRRGVAVGLRAAVGGLLITVGTRVAGPRPDAVGLRRTPT